MSVRTPATPPATVRGSQLRGAALLVRFVIDFQKRNYKTAQ